MNTHDENSEIAKDPKNKRVRQKPLKQKSVRLLIKRALVNLVQKSKNEYVVLTAVKLLMTDRDPIRSVRAIMKRGHINIREDGDARQYEDEEHSARIVEIQSILAELTEAKHGRVAESLSLGQDGAAGATDTAG